MVPKIVTENLNALKSSPQTFESIYRIMKDSLSSERFGEWLENGRISTIAYYELFERVDMFSVAAVNYASKNGSTSKFAGIHLENSVDWVAIFWGLLQAGFVPILLNTRHNLAINNDIISEMNPAFVVTKDPMIDRAVSIGDLIEAGKGSRFEKSMIKWSDEIVMVTSGSTAKPKIVSHSGKTACHMIEMADYIVRTNSSILHNRKLDFHMLAFLPFYHIFGLLATLMLFSFYGRGFVFLPKYDSQSIQFVCKRLGVTHFFAIPLVWEKTVASLEKEVERQGKTEKFNRAIRFSNKLQNIFPHFGPKFARSVLFKSVRQQVLGEKLTYLISGGGFISPRTLEVLNGLGYSIYPGYGLTECGIVCVELSRKPKFRCGSSVGKLFNNVNYKLSDEGELLISKDYAMNGIYVDGKFVNYVEEYYPTNDIVKIDNDGRNHIIGRIDDVIIGPNGENISPEEIESRIDKGAFDEEAMIYCRLPGEQEPQMVLILADDGKLGAYEKASSLKCVYASIDLLTLSERPVKVFNLIGSCPVNFKGVDRKLLSRKLENYELYAVECTRPTDEEVTRTRSADYAELIEKICDVFAEVLEKERSEITETSNFISLGGDSMQYVELLSKASEISGKSINMADKPLITPMAITDYIIEQKKDS